MPGSWKSPESISQVEAVQIKRIHDFRTLSRTLLIQDMLVLNKGDDPQIRLLNGKWKLCYQAARVLMRRCHERQQRDLPLGWLAALNPLHHNVERKILIDNHFSVTFAYFQPESVHKKVIIYYRRGPAISIQRSLLVLLRSFQVTAFYFSAFRQSMRPTGNWSTSSRLWDLSIRHNTDASLKVNILGVTIIVVARVRVPVPAFFGSTPQGTMERVSKVATWETSQR